MAGRTSISAGDVFYVKNMSFGDTAIDAAAMTPKFLVAVRNAGDDETQIPFVVCDSFKPDRPDHLEWAERSTAHVPVPRSADGGPSFFSRHVLIDCTKVYTLPR